MYQELVAKGQISFPLQAEHIKKIDSVVKTVHATYFRFARYPTSEDKAAAYFTFIIKDHPFIDGNKRMTVLMLEFCCIAFGLKLRLPPDITVDQIAVATERSGEAHHLADVVKEVLFG